LRENQTLAAHPTTAASSLKKTALFHLAKIA